jgi:hypothetical protein
VLEVACRSATDERIATLNQLRHLVICADRVRGRFAGLSVGRLATETAGLRPRPTDTVRYSRLFAMRMLGRRVAALDAELVELNAVMRPLIDRAGPGLLWIYGVGYDVAAKVLIAAGDNPDRLRSEARSPSPSASPSRGLIRQDRPAPTQPWRQPTSQQGALPRRDHAHGIPSRDQGVPRRATSREQVDRRDRSHPQALRRARSVQAPPTRRHLTAPEAAT